MIEEKINELLATQIQDLPKVNDNVEGIVITNEKNTLYVDLGILGTGIIFGKEYLVIKDLIKNIQPGVKITSKILELEGEKGYLELSLKEAKSAEVWQEAIKYMKEKKVLSLFIKDANKGGLIVNWQGLVGFVPVSQLTKENYPNITGGDKNRILLELKKFIGEKMDLVIITVDSKENKIIFSEKNVDNEKEGDIKNKKKISGSDKKTNMLEKYSIGDVLDAEVIGVVNFGIFCKLLSTGDEGLIHISEISWSLINDTSLLYKIDDKIKVKVIEINQDKISLSIKSLTTNPWEKVDKKYKEGAIVKAVVIKLSEHGALVSVEEGIYGLVHVSEFKNIDELKERYELGEVYDFKIKIIDAELEKMILTLPEKKIKNNKEEEKEKD